MSKDNANPGRGAEYNPLVSPQLENPHAFLARARREEPVFYSPVLSSWVVTRHADISAVVADTVLAAHGPIEHQVACARGVVEFQRCLSSALEERKTSPREDLMSDIINEGQGITPPMSMAELVSLLLQVHFAGHETTAGLIVGAVELLLRSPEQLQALRDDPSLISGTIEEALRMVSPVHAMFRTALEDVEIGGVKIPKGGHIRIVYASANRDEARFHEPDHFDIRRPDVKKHLAFGQGIHFCVGAPLARLEARIALEALLQRLPGLRLVPGQNPGFLRSVTVRRHESLEVAWDA